MRCKKEIALEEKIHVEKECMNRLLLVVKKHVVSGNLDLAEERMKDFNRSLKQTNVLVEKLKKLRREKLFGVVKGLKIKGCNVSMAVFDEYNSIDSREEKSK